LVREVLKFQCWDGSIVNDTVSCPTTTTTLTTTTTVITTTTVVTTTTVPTTTVNIPSETTTTTPRYCVFTVCGKNTKEYKHYKNWRFYDPSCADNCYVVGNCYYRYKERCDSGCSGGECLSQNLSVEV